ncbi:MAG: hypothetical protein E7028_04695 [Planctomycetaceae bacterium]|nr:hypothetical protein [Planctomycetaceae bacterium]
MSPNDKPERTPCLTAAQKTYPSGQKRAYSPILNQPPLFLGKIFLFPKYLAPGSRQKKDTAANEVQEKHHFCDYLP